MLKYLKNTGSSSATTSTAFIQQISSFSNVVTINNNSSSINTTTGALIVTGGIGVGGNINAGGNIKAFNSEFTGNLTIQGHTTSNYVTVPGILTATLGEFTYLTSNTLNVVGQTITSALEVENTGNFGIITAPMGVIENLTATVLDGLTDLTTTNATATNLNVDNIYPNTGSQINLGDIGNIRIVGGSFNQVLGTDGNGNLTWLPGTGAISVGTGLQRDGDIISLSGTGFNAGTFNQVTIDQYGRVVSATNVSNDLQNITNRNATTNNAISITNNSESVDVASGALTVTGGVGIAGTLTAQDLVVAANAQITADLTVIGQANFNNTVNFNSSQVPIKISSGLLAPDPAVGSLEFDGTSLYITTNVGRQLVQVKNSQLSAAIAFIARAVAARNINIANGNQYTDNGEDNWDDVILEYRNVVLLTNQTNPVENGLYIWNTENSPLTRHPDFNTLSVIRQGTIIFVSEGIDNGGSFYKVITPDTISIGTTQLSITQHFNADNIALSSLPKDTTAGLLVRTQYGSIALREIQSTSSWMSVTNPNGYDGNIVINTTTIPVSSGGTGRTSINGWMKGSGTNIQGSATIPLADISDAGTIASQNANNVSIIGGTIDNTIIGENTSASGQFTTITISDTSTYSTFFNGTTDYLTIANPPESLRNWGANSFTIEMWIYVISIAQPTVLIGQLIPNSAKTWFTYWWALQLATNGSINFTFFNTAGNTISFSTPPIISGNQWHHVAFVKDDLATPNLAIYVNGIKVSTVNVNMSINSAATSSTGPITIGQYYNSWFNGYISNLRVVNGTAVYTSNFTPSSTRLLAIPGTSLLTCQNNQFVDTSLNTLEIVANGNVQLSTFSPFASSVSSSDLVLNNYLTGLLRVIGDSSFDGTLQVAGTIYENGYEVLNNNDVIDGGEF